MAREDTEQNEQDRQVMDTQGVTMCIVMINGDSFDTVMCTLTVNGDSFDTGPSSPLAVLVLWFVRNFIRCPHSKLDRKM